MSVATNEEQLCVSTDGTAGPFIIVPASRLDSVSHALSDAQISFTVEEDAVSLGGQPALSVVNLNEEANLERVQEVLDGLARRGRRPRRPDQPRLAGSPVELILKGETDQVAQLTSRIQSSTPDGWRRRLDLEQRLQQMRVARTGTFCFSKQFEDIQNSEFTVWLRTRGSSQLYVSNIVPSDRGTEFGYSEYNRVLSDFKEKFVYKLIEGLRIHAIQVPLSLGLSMENLLSPEALRHLTEFSQSADKGRLHPLDVNRWNSFIVQTHIDKLTIDPALLDALLDTWLENEGWPDAMRDQLVTEYESARSLLTTYDEEQALR